MRITKTLSLGVISAFTVTLASPSISQAAESSEDSCSTLTSNLHQRFDPDRNLTLLTTSLSEANNAITNYGFVGNQDIPVQVSATDKEGLTEFYRYFNPKTEDFIWLKDGSEAHRAKTKYGYKKQSNSFSALENPVGDCQTPVYRLLKGANHTYSTPENLKSLQSDGWKVETIAFYGAKPPVDSSKDPATLNPTGQVPDTDYSIPENSVFVSPTGNDVNSGTKESPFKTLRKALSSTNDGTIVMREGVYHENVGFSSKNITIQPYPHEEVWMDGAKVIPSNNWVRDGEVWKTKWETPTFCDNKYYERSMEDQRTDNRGPCAHIDAEDGADPSNPIPQDPQQLWKNGQQLTQTNSVDKLTANNFYYDWNTRELKIGFDPSASKMEGSALPKAITAASSTFTLKGLGFRRFASNEYSNASTAAVYVAASQAHLENNAFVNNSGQGLFFHHPKNSTVDHNVFVSNGYTAMGANGESQQGVSSNFMVRNNRYVKNNSELFNKKCTLSCGAAEVKLAHIKDFTFNNNLVEGSGDGVTNGLWCDLLCENGKYINNDIYNVDKALISEVSDNPIIANNFVKNSTVAINLASANARVYNNTIENASSQGIRVYDDPRSYGVDGWYDVGPNTQNVQIANNVVKNAYLPFAAQPGNTVPREYFSLLDRNVYLNNSDRPTRLRWIPEYNAPYELYGVQDKALFTQRHGWEDNSYWGNIGDSYKVHPAKLPQDIATLLNTSQNVTKVGSFN